MGQTVKQVIVEELKKQGLDVGEEMAVAAVKGAISALKKVVEMTENKYDDMALPVLAVIEPKIMEALDKIDGEDDPGR